MSKKAIYMEDAIAALRNEMHADKDLMSALLCEGVGAVLKRLPAAQSQHEVRFSDADHVWIDGKQYISLQRFGEAVKDAQPEIIRCKDCKHRPTGEDRDDLEFPDDVCPCKCEDYWYSWKPADNWFCGNGERKDGERHEG